MAIYIQREWRVGGANNAKMCAYRTDHSGCMTGVGSLAHFHSQLQIPAPRASLVACHVFQPHAHAHAHVHMEFPSMCSRIYFLENFTFFLVFACIKIHIYTYNLDQILFSLFRTTNTCLFLISGEIFVFQLICCYAPIIEHIISIQHCDQ